MRIAVGANYHESNTFFSQAMTVEKFAEQALHRGPGLSAEDVRHQHLIRPIYPLDPL